MVTEIVGSIALAIALLMILGFTFWGCVEEYRESKKRYEEDKQLKLRALNELTSIADTLECIHEEMVFSGDNVDVSKN